jgi:membrane fusion protein (multidrug efflux system)
MSEQTAMEVEEAASAAMANKGSGKSGKKKKRGLAFFALLLAASVCYGAYWGLFGRYHEVTEDAYVQGDTVNVGTQVSGTVVAVNFALTQYVERGTEIIRLDDTDARVALTHAEADLAQAVRNAAQLFRVAEANEAKVSELKLQLDQAGTDLERNRKLVPIGGISSEAMQHLETTYRTTKASYEQSQHQLQAAQAAIARTTVDQHPIVKQAEARVRSAWTALARTRVLAPVSGYIAQKQAAVGLQATPGMPLLSIVPLQDVYVAANFKESQLGDIRLGQPVTLTSDLYGSDVTYHGRVVGFSSGTGAALSVLPPQNASGNWIKIVQRLPVRIALNAEEMEKHPLMLGLSMTADVDVHGKQGNVLSRVPVFDGAMATGVYANQIDGADKTIARIVNDNLLSPAGGADKRVASKRAKVLSASSRRFAAQD